MSLELPAKCEESDGTNGLDSLLQYAYKQSRTIPTLSILSQAKSRTGKYETLIDSISYKNEFEREGSAAQRGKGRA